jgi:uncharacterized metal-binding protein
LQCEEEIKLKNEGDNMKRKDQDINLVKRKINEERTEKKKEEQTRLAERSAVIEDEHNAEVRRLEEHMELCTHVSDSLIQKEGRNRVQPANFKTSCQNCWKSCILEGCVND